MPTSKPLTYRGTSACARLPRRCTFGQRSSTDTSVCAGPDEREGDVRHPGCDLRQERLIDPLVEAAHVADDGPLERHEIRGQRRPVVADAIELLEVHAERKQVHAVAEFRRPLTQLLRRHEHQVRLAEQLLLARHDLAGRRRARGQVVDAVVDRQLRIEIADQIERERRRQKRPDDRTVEAGGAHPPPQGAHEHEAIDPPRHPRIGKRHQQRRIDEHVGPLFPESLRAAPPVADPLADARQVGDVRRPDAGVLDEQDAMPLRRQRRHDLLVPLPDEVPVDRRDAEDVWTADHHARPATSTPEFRSTCRYASSTRPAVWRMSN